MVPWNLRKRHILPVNQNLSSVYFSLPKFQLVSCNLSLAMICKLHTHKLPVLCSSTLIGACHGKSYRIHSSSTDQRIRNPVSLESKIQDCLRLQRARSVKYCLADQKYWAIKMILFKFQIRLVLRVKFKQTTWRAWKQVKIQPFSFNRNNLLQITGEIGDFGDMRWELVGTTLLSWVVVYLCLFKGIKSSGKVKYILR